MDKLGKKIKYISRVDCQNIVCASEKFSRYGHLKISNVCKKEPAGWNLMTFGQIK